MLLIGLLILNVWPGLVMTGNNTGSGSVGSGLLAMRKNFRRSSESTSLKPFSLNPYNKSSLSHFTVSSVDLYFFCTRSRVANARLDARITACRFQCPQPQRSTRSIQSTRTAIATATTIMPIMPATTRVKATTIMWTRTRFSPCRRRSCPPLWFIYHHLPARRPRLVRRNAVLWVVWVLLGWLWRTGRAPPPSSSSRWRGGYGEEGQGDVSEGKRTGVRSCRWLVACIHWRSSFFASSEPFNAPLPGLFTQYTISVIFQFAVPPGDAYLFMISSEQHRHL